MKTAISVPDPDFERFERVAARHGMNRSEFYRIAGQRLADELEGSSDLTALANEAMARAGQLGQHTVDSLFLNESERVISEDSVW